MSTVEQVGSEDALEEVPERPRRRMRSYKIQEVIKRRQIILVQVVKEERGSKGAALTTYLSLAGRYTVLMPNTGRGGGISRKITQPQDRKRLKAIAHELEVPEGMGLIVRTAGAARTKQEIKRDFEYLLRLWENVRDLTLQSTAPCLVYEEGNLIKRSIRDLYAKDIDEILVAGEAAHKEASDFMRMLSPSQAKSVIKYEAPEPLFARYPIERQLNAMFSPYVTLRSGGYLVINQTEALVSVDVNSGKATREFSIEETALNTNLEASEEIARQLKLRDLAGLIVIDFIDMEERRNNRKVENRLKDALRHDRARIQVGRISHFGLLEMSRQRLRTGVLEGSTSQCPHCQGTGIIRSTESVALAVLRALEDQLLRDARGALAAVTTAEVALYILNNKRTFVTDMERRYEVTINVQASERMQGANFAIERSAAAQPVAQKSAERPVVNMEWGFEGQEEDEGAGEPAGASGERERRTRGRGAVARGVDVGAAGARIAATSARATVRASGRSLRATARLTRSSARRRAAPNPPTRAATMSRPATRWPAAAISRWSAMVRRARRRHARTGGQGAAVDAGAVAVDATAMRVRASATRSRTRVKRATAMALKRRCRRPMHPRWERRGRGRRPPATCGQTSRCGKRLRHAVSAITPRRRPSRPGTRRPRSMPAMADRASVSPSLLLPSRCGNASPSLCMPSPCEPSPRTSSPYMPSRRPRSPRARPAAVGGSYGSSRRDCRFGAPRYQQSGRRRSWNRRLGGARVSPPIGRNDLAHEPAERVAGCCRDRTICRGCRGAAEGTREGSRSCGKGREEGAGGEGKERLQRHHGGGCLQGRRHLLVDRGPHGQGDRQAEAQGLLQDQAEAPGEEESGRARQRACQEVGPAIRWRLLAAQRAPSAARHTPSMVCMGLSTTVAVTSAISATGIMSGTMTWVDACPPAER